MHYPELDHCETRQDIREAILAILRHRCIEYHEEGLVNASLLLDISFGHFPGELAKILQELEDDGLIQYAGCSVWGLHRITLANLSYHDALPTDHPRRDLIKESEATVRRLSGMGMKATHHSYGSSNGDGPTVIMRVRDLDHLISRGRNLIA